MSSRTHSKGRRILFAITVLTILAALPASARIEVHFASTFDAEGNKLQNVWLVGVDCGDGVVQGAGVCADDPASCAKTAAAKICGSSAKDEGSSRSEGDRPGIKYRPGLTVDSLRFDDVDSLDLLSAGEVTPSFVDGETLDGASGRDAGQSYRPECDVQPPQPPEYSSRVAARRDAEGRSTLIVTADSGDGSPVDEVRLELGRRGARDAEPLSLPRGWAAEAERGTLIARGPAMAPPVFLKFGVDDPPAEVKFEVLAGERGKFGEKVDVPRLEPVEPATELDGLLAVPRGVIAGEVVGLRPLDPVRTPPEGQWSIGGQVLPAESWPRHCFDEPPLRWPVPAGLVGGLLAVTYVDPWGDEVVMAEDVPVEPVEAPEIPVGDSVAVLEAATEIAMAGGQACGCGVFPGERSRMGLLFDGQPLGAPIAAGPYAVHFQLPSSLGPGSHELRGDAAAGVGGNTLSIDVIEVRPSIDQNALRRGGSTQLRLEVVGSERPVDFEVYNNTPQIVSLEGGDRQTLTTSGGHPNALSVTVRGRGEGAFDLGYEVQLDPCPCEKN